MELMQKVIDRLDRGDSRSRSRSRSRRSSVSSKDGDRGVSDGVSGTPVINETIIEVKKKQKKTF